MADQYEKDPSAVLSYGRDWTAWLAGDSISTSTWTLDPANPDAALTIVSTSNTTAKTFLVLSGGTVGKRYRITNRITTAGGYTDERSDYWEIVQR